jgi:hypothetical protein
MFLFPVSETYIAELMTTTAGHMIATFVPLYEHIACRTSFPIQKVLLKIFITRSFVLLEHTLRAIDYFTLLACVYLIEDIDDTITFLFWA